MKELSTEVSDGGGHQAFASYVEAQQPALKREIIPDSSQIRNFVRISGRNELLSMSFASNCLGESVVYDSDADCLTIKSIPSSLKSKLIKHLKE